MKAAFLVDVQTYEVRDIPEPICPDDGLIIKVGACGVCGSDLRRWREGPPAGIDGYTPGHEVSGKVIEIGKDVTRFSLGDPVAIAPDIHCSQCWYCHRGLFNLCDNLRLAGTVP